MNEANDPNLWQENGTWSMIIPKQIMMQEMKLYILWKFENLIFEIRTMLTFQ